MFDEVSGAEELPSSSEGSPKAKEGKFSQSKLYGTKYQKEWEKDKSRFCLKPSKRGAKLAYCTVCNADFSIHHQ